MDSNNLKLTLGVIVGTLVLVGGIVGAALLLEKPDEFSVADTIGESVDAKGNQDSSVTIVEFSDLQCPACQAAQPALKQFVDDYQDQVFLVFRHFPLAQHKNAIYAAYAAEAAAQQDKFWEVHDWLFENQSSWEDDTVNGEYFYAQFGEEFELDQDQFLADYKSDQVRGLVAQDTSAGSQLGVNSTPTFFINGKKQTGVLSYEQLVELTGVQPNTPTPIAEDSPKS